MSTRGIVYLLLAAVVAVGLAVWAVGSRAPQQEVGLQGPMLPALGERLNQLEALRIIGAGNASLATLQRGDAGWTLAERQGYPVDAGKLRALLVGLAEARRVEAKTANPDLHARLGVEDIAAADAKGVVLELLGGGDPLRIIVGENNARGQGTYLRLEGDPQSWLVDRSIAVERRPVEWLQRELVNLPTSRIASVEVTPAGGPTIRIGRADDAAGDFRLLDLPRGREQASDFIADATAGLLDSLRFEDVMADDASAAGEQGLREAAFRSREGLVIRLTAWQHEGSTRARFSAELDETAAADWAQSQESAAAAPAVDATGAEVAESADAGASTDEAESESTAAASAEQGSAEDPLAALREERDTLQRRFAERVFVLPAFKATNLNRSLDDYLKPLDK